MFHQTHFQFNEELRYRAGNGTKYIVIHHSEVTTPHTAEDIHCWHQKKGWAGIGYHFFIRKDGEIYEGRPRDTVGAHAKGYNSESIGVCFEGDFNKEKMSDKQLDASVMLLSLISMAYPDAELCMHSQLVKEKSCPGKNFPYDRLTKKVEECKKYLEALFGSQIESWVANEEWRHFHDGLGDEEEERRRHNAPDLIHYGNFNYMDILDMFSEIYEEYGWD